MRQFAFLQTEYLSSFNLKAQRHSRHFGRVLQAAGTGIHKKESGLGITEHLRNVSVAADEYVRMPSVQKSLGLSIIKGTSGGICPVASPSESYMRHQNPETVADEKLKGWVFLPYILSIAVAVHSDKRPESGNLPGALERAEITRVPDLVNGFQEILHVIGEDTVRV